MTSSQEKAINLALNVLYVGFFECPRHDFEYFVHNEDWALLMTAAGHHGVHTPPAQLAVAALQQAVAREGFFAEMTDFKPPVHFCSFLREQIRIGERTLDLQPCAEGQAVCPYATFDNLKHSQSGSTRPAARSTVGA
jgi:hypothetical protein